MKSFLIRLLAGFLFLVAAIYSFQTGNLPAAVIFLLIAALPTIGIVLSINKRKDRNRKSRRNEDAGMKAAKKFIQKLERQRMIGLTPQEEISLGRKVQEMMTLRKRYPRDGKGGPEYRYTDSEKKIIKLGENAKNEMIGANIRLLANLSKGYIGKGYDIEALLEKGKLGLIRAVETYDPNRGERFSTYAYWHIKQHMENNKNI